MIDNLTLGRVNSWYLPDLLDSGFWFLGSNQADWLLGHCSDQCPARPCAGPSARRTFCDLRSFCCCQHYSWHRHAGTSNTRHRSWLAMDIYRSYPIHRSLMDALDCSEPFCWEFAIELIEAIQLDHWGLRAPSLLARKPLAELLEIIEPKLINEYSISKT